MLLWSLWTRAGATPIRPCSLNISHSTGMGRQSGVIIINSDPYYRILYYGFAFNCSRQRGRGEKSCAARWFIANNWRVETRKYSATTIDFPLIFTSLSIHFFLFFYQFNTYLKVLLIWKDGILRFFSLSRIQLTLWRPTTKRGPILIYFYISYYSHFLNFLEIHIPYSDLLLLMIINYWRMVNFSRIGKT